MGKINNPTPDIGACTKCGSENTTERSEEHMRVELASTFECDDCGNEWKDF